MGHTPINRWRWVALFLAGVAVLSAAVWETSYRQSLEQVRARGASDLALASDRLVTQLQRYRIPAVLLAHHPLIAALHDGGARTPADRLLLETVDRTGALTAVYLDREGQVLAASDTDTTVAVDGPDIVRAGTGALGAWYGLLPGSTRRVFRYAAPAFAPDGHVRGVVVLMINLESPEQVWRGARPSVFFTDPEGEVFITNRSELLFWRWTPEGVFDADGTAIPLQSRIRAGHEIWKQRLSPYVPELALHLVNPLPVIGMQGEVLVDVAPARRIAALQVAVFAAVCLFFGSLLFLATERRRALAAANQELETRVRLRTKALEEANTALRHEVAEREAAQARLTRAQADLVQAGKLSALGQMSAGISHELNQPLMAIGSFAETAQTYLARGDTDRAGTTLGRVLDMSGRMARIIKNLRAFARNESEPMSRVDLRAVLQSAVELTEARLRSEGVELDAPALQDDAPIWVRGGEVRLTQVFVNLITNAADAMIAQDDKRISITLDHGARLRVHVADIGPGIADPDRIFEPFYSTKEVGSDEGMGLGLSISYGLVQSFGGDIRGSNTDVGAMFTVELDDWREEAVA